jgi:mannose-6-phosphate isomerase-like protein (cupin superfamily)
MNVYDLSAAAIRKMARVDLATVTEEPASAIGNFDFHGCTCGVASFVGQPPWELHDGGDELLHILAGQSMLTVLAADGSEQTRLVREGEVVLVPRGCWHRNSAPDGVTMLYMTPTQGGAHSFDDPREGRG